MRANSIIADIATKVGRPSILSVNIKLVEKFTGG